MSNFIRYTLLILLVAFQYTNCISETFTFEPEKPYTISNPLLWQIKASCKIAIQDSDDLLLGIMDKGTGHINGLPVDTSKEVQITVKNGDILTIDATRLSEVKITNKGLNPVVADCSLAAQSAAEINYMKSLFEEYAKMERDNLKFLN